MTNQKITEKEAEPKCQYNTQAHKLLEEKSKISTNNTTKIS